MFLKNKLLVLIICSILSFIQCTTEWFGDLRAHLNPPSSAPFYDITYDDEGYLNI